MSSFVVCHQIKLQSLSEMHPDSSESISQSKTNDFVELSRHAGAWERSRCSLQKEPVNDFPPCFKVLNDKKTGVCVYMSCVCVVVLSLSVVAGFHCACASVNSVWDLQLSTHV